MVVPTLPLQEQKLMQQDILWEEVCKAFHRFVPKVLSLGHTIKVCYIVYFMLN